MDGIEKKDPVLSLWIKRMDKGKYLEQLEANIVEQLGAENPNYKYAC